MKIMFREGGFHNFHDDEVESALKDGWVDGEPIRQALLDAKRKDRAKSDTVTIQPIAKPVEVATITPQPEVKRSPGRPRNVVPSILNDGEL
jgi:hypothetical protein